MEKEYLLEWPPKEAQDLNEEPKSKKVKKETDHGNEVVSLEEMNLIKKEIDIHSLIAQWWKWKLKTEQQKFLTNSTNPDTLLYKVAKLPCTKKMIKMHIKYIEDHLKKNSSNFASLASCHYLLGNITEAMSFIERAINLAQDDSNIKWHWCIINKQYIVLKKQEELLQKSTIHNCTLPKPTQVERRGADTLSFKDYFLNYAMKHIPVIITGLNVTTSMQWTLNYIKQVIGTRMAPLKRPVADSVEWARLESCSQMKVKDFIDSLKDQQFYLFDWSIPLFCPELAHELVIPKYFAGDFLQRTPQGSLYQDSWPSLFIAPSDINSALHIDAFGSNFWMALFEGSKRWLFFPPDDIPCLYPQYNLHSTDPVFDINFTNHGQPLITLTHPMECVLQPGEVLFVPAGCPHQVENLEASLAISSNFVDLSNIDLVKKELAVNSLVDPRADELLRSLNDESFCTKMDEMQESLSWKEFKTWPRKVT